MNETPTSRLQTLADIQNFTPVYVVWEITLACNLKCMHCGSRAGRPRSSELTTAECFALIDSLAKLGTREITLIGGEAYLRRDWPELVRAIRQAGMRCTMQTGARNLDQRRVEAAADAGLQACGISIDGPREIHDSLRGVRGSYEAAIKAIELFSAAEIVTSVNTQIGNVNAPYLELLFEALKATKIRNWQLQLTVAMGNAADNPEILLQPYQLLDLMPRLAALRMRAAKQNIIVQAGNNLGYFGPFEWLWNRGTDGEDRWFGCSAGVTGMGIEADGTIKGCPSLPTASYSMGNVREMVIDRIWLDGKTAETTRSRSTEELWGYCGTCYYSDVCRGGCSWTSHVLFGRPGNNPFCHYRALQLDSQGLRERIEPMSKAGGRPFDHGLFKLVLEDLSGRVFETTDPSAMPKTISAPPMKQPDAKVELCASCRHFVISGSETCPQCAYPVKLSHVRNEVIRITGRDLEPASSYLSVPVET